MSFVLYSLHYGTFLTKSTVGQFQNGNVLLKNGPLLSPRPVTETGDLLGASTCYGPVVDGHPSHACLIPFDYQISWNVVHPPSSKISKIAVGSSKIGSNFLAVFVTFLATKPMRCMNDFDQPLPSSCSCPLSRFTWLSGFHVLPPEQWHC